MSDSSTAFRPLDPENIQPSDQSTLTMKLLYAGTSNQSDPTLGPGQSYVAIREDLISLVANLNNCIAVSQDFGISLTGPISIAAMPDQVSFGGGYWRINPLVLTGLPSTNATPIPWLVQSTPKLTTGASEVSDAVSFLQSMGDF